MEKKPNQIIDEITQVIYPPAEAVVNQLTTIRAIIPSTIKMYESTKDIHTIQPNLDMIQRAVDYLRGAPMQEELKPLPEDTLKPVYIPSSTGFNITSSLNRDGEYDVTIVGIGVEKKISHPELFGEVDFLATEMGIEIPVTCGKNYLVTQANPVLEHYKDDPSIQLGTEDEWIKEKIYTMDEDFFEYAFLLQEGRSKIRIAIYADYEDPIIFNITSHIHLKQEELPEEPPITEEPEPDDKEQGEDNDGE